MIIKKFRIIKKKNSKKLVGLFNFLMIKVMTVVKIIIVKINLQKSKISKMVIL